jgi:hypothetical protein
VRAARRARGVPCSSRHRTSGDCEIKIKKYIKILKNLQSSPKKRKKKKKIYYVHVSALRGMQRAGSGASCVDAAHAVSFCCHRVFFAC